MNFKNKHAVITGGSNGIGRCIAEAFLREGAAVTIIDIDENAPANAQFYHGDIADKSVLEAFVDSLKQPADFFVSSDKAGFITGENITVDGGMSKQMIYHGDYGWSLS
jgi:NAD(P)-dependent dehydrogenase (short-subunit alcohol dehydrogenase family)